MGILKKSNLTYEIVLDYTIYVHLLIYIISVKELLK